MAPSPVIFIGLDAAEPSILEELMANGRMPALAALACGGAAVDLRGPLESLPGAIWPEVHSGISAARQALYYHPRQLRTGEAELRPIEHSDVRTEENFWTVAADAGRRVAVVDVPQALEHPGSPAVVVREWGMHDRTFSVASEPPELIAELLAVHGEHPVLSCDRQGSTPERQLDLLDRLHRGVEAKTGVLLDVFGRSAWDLFACAFGETHCAGHQFWHLHDPNDRDHPEDPGELADAIRSVYAAADRGIAALAAAAGDDARIIVLASHGMGPNIGGPQLLPEVLARLGLGPGSAAVSRWRGRLPTLVIPIGKRLLPKPADAALRRAAGATGSPFTSGATRVASVPNNRCGAIRVNLRGREPMGSVAPDDELARLLDELRGELHDLADPVTGQPIVQDVFTPAEAFDGALHPDLPDLLVTFRADLGPIDACTSPTVGLVSVPARHPAQPRSGDHTPRSRLWASAAVGPLRDVGSVLDVAPTVLHLLGVTPPAATEGSTLLRPQSSTHR